MRTLFVTLLLAVVLLLVVGFSRGWFTASWGDTAADQVNMQVQVNKTRIREDVHQAKKQVADTARQVRDQVKQTTDQLKKTTAK